jgi:pimeloyl-ACP methyl ester carboxylesterase
MCRVHNGEVTMPYATNDGVRTYYETEGSGPPLMLVHPFTGSLQGWRDNGYVAAFKDDFSLILVDVRAHGRSDKPHDPAAHAYDLRVRDVLSVLDAEGTERVHYWGYSMGGRIGWAIANTTPARLRSLTIGGAHPYPVDRATWQQMADAFLAEAGAPQASTANPDPDRDAVSLAASALATRDFPGETEHLTACTAPTLVYCGDKDPAYEPSRRAIPLLSHAAFVTLPGLDHGQGWHQSEIVIPHVRAFLVDVIQSEQRGH